MLTNVLDTLRLVLDTLTDPETDESCRVDPVCRVVLSPGFEVPWDVCESCGNSNGQLWAALQSAPVTSVGAGCYQINWTAEIGITRCAATVNNDGSPPQVSRVEADAAQQARDGDAIASAIVCCLKGHPDTADLGIELVSWNALGPQGGCVGGAWQVRGVLSVCC